MFTIEVAAISQYVRPAELKSLSDPCPRSFPFPIQIPPKNLRWRHLSMAGFLVTQPTGTGIRGMLLPALYSRYIPMAIEE
jgi:hypothetical protein